ncbi:NAD(P)/FAD-dependent oxidoreductase [Bradyrhizobium sp. LHD-71]|uniref:dihydrolipoyl dehydrogenase family protein n=1 Tax=Bradyrhizobium sp. LHD-71 TaxID=3072141 RepID=UPI00280C6B21|nr:NAD(P)/FAD-dependent oxidoreductase [Bradyrhizobium sp. LHD-71]MDQ8726336.1 NAD(P)/FAD-dependent oxidoreductase [Bradyrhizobium sp. LHD-71]
MATSKFDVLIIGGGNAGIGAATRARAAGLSVAMVEGRDMGGTCPNRGCTPKKVLVAAAHALHEIEQAKVHRITVGEPHLDWAAMIDREKDLIKDVPASLTRAMEKRGIGIVRGDAVFTGPHAARVDGRMLEAKTIVIATGSKPRPLPIPGAEHMITSDDVLSERTPPASIVFVGGGVIALEFSHVYARAGAKVTILEVLPRLLPAVDTDAVARLQAESERLGIRIETGIKVVRVEKTPDALRVFFERDGKTFTVDADRVVNGAGRVANVDTLDLAAANVAHDNNRIALDAHLRSTSNPAVYVCGDAVPTSPQLSPIATYEGEIVGRNIVDGPRHTPDYASVPTAVYTVPALSSVGLTEQAARDQSRKVKVRVNDMLSWFSARTYAETVAWSKIIVDETDDSIVGAHFVGHSGEELVNIFGLAIAHKLTATQIRDKIYAYPTFTSDIKNLL